MRMFLRFLGELLSSLWGLTCVALSVISVIFVYTNAFGSSIRVSNWVPLSVSFVAWFLAPFGLYKRKEQEVKALRLKVERLEVRQPDLFIHVEPRQTFYVQVDPGNRTKVRGIQFRLPLTIENRGDVNSVVHRFDLYVEETEMDYADLKLSPGNSIQTAETLYSGLDATWLADRNTVVVEAHNTRSGTLPLYVEDARLAGPRELRCTLTIIDTNGITARADLTAKDADAR